MNIPSYVVANPTGNVTILVTSPVSPELQSETGSFLLQLEPRAEQVGFYSAGKQPFTAGIRMGGGEFCGNAALSAAAYALWQSGQTEATVTLDFSGVEDPVEVHVRRDGERSFSGRVRMPYPLSFSIRNLE